MSSDADSRRPLIRWPLPLAAVWVSFPVVGVLLSISFTPIAPYDYWWHLAMGRMTAATGTVPSSNLFLYTLPVDAPFLNQPWLGQLALYEVFRTWGHWGPYLLRNLIAGGTWIGLAAAAVDRSPDPRVAGGVLLAVGGLSGIVFGVRTRMFALPLYVATLAVTLAVADGRWSARWLWSLVPVTAVWSNLHGSFALAPALVAAIGGSRVVEEAIAGELEADLVRTWGGPGAAVALAGMANPHGWRAYEYVVELTFFSAIPSTVSEWQPPDPYQFFGAASLVLMVLALAIAAYRRSSVRLDEAVLLAATTYLAAGSLRSIFFWAGAVAVVLPRHVSALMAAGDGAASTTPRQGWLHATVVGLLVLSAVLGQPGLPLFDLRNRALGGTVRRGGTEHRLLSAQNSVHLVDRLAAEGGSGRIFHGQSLGGLLDFRLGARRPASPRRVAFVDQRMTLVPPRLWDAYFEISEARAGWRQALQKWEVDTLLLNPDGQRRLVQAVEASADWRLVAIGSGHLRFERRSD